MKDCDMDSVRRMVNFLYQGYYNCEGSEKTHPIAVHIAMFALADKYLIKRLLIKSGWYFSKAVGDEEDLNILSQYTKAVYDLQCDFSNRLRGILIAEYQCRIDSHAAGSDLQQSLYCLLGEVPEFAKDMARSYIDRRFAQVDEWKARLAAKKKRRISESPSDLVDD